jgi:tRNA(adenine34) deaminase
MATIPDSIDATRLRELAAYTRRSFAGAHPTPFGCDILSVETGKRVFRGVNAVWAESDPSAHAELRAVRRACKKQRTTSLRGCVLYTTCEPCPMCMGSILWAGLDRVVYGATISDAAKHCSQIHVSAKTLAARSDIPCEVVGPVARQECYALFTDPVMAEAMSRWRLG